MKKKPNLIWLVRAENMLNKCSAFTWSHPYQYLEGEWGLITNSLTSKVHPLHKNPHEVLERVSSFNHWILWQCLNYWLYSKNRSSDNMTTLKDQIRPAKNAIFTKWLSESLKKKLRSQQVVCKFYEFLRNRSKERLIISSQRLW